MRKPTIVTLLLAGIVLAGCASGQRSVKNQAAATTATTAADTTEETFPDEGIAPPASKRVGEAATLVESDSEREVIRVVVDRVKFSGGDEYNRPERGNFLGVHVKVRALADVQSSLWGDFYVLMRGHHYDGDAYAEGFEPSLDYMDLSEGETAEGWLVFDVPARHGQVVLGQSSAAARSPIGASSGTGDPAVWDKYTNRCAIRTAYPQPVDGVAAPWSLDARGRESSRRTVATW
jgi:hypothetical protein